MRLHHAPSAIVGGAAWVEVDGKLEWRGRPAPPLAPVFAAGDRVALRVDVCRQGRTWAAGTCGTVAVAPAAQDRELSLDLSQSTTNSAQPQVVQVALTQLVWLGGGAAEGEPQDA